MPDVLVYPLSNDKECNSFFPSSQFFAKILQCHSNRDIVEKFRKESPDKEFPEQVIFFSLCNLYLNLLVSIIAHLHSANIIGKLHLFFFLLIVHNGK